MRRLRENTTLDSEISKTGEVTVEGHLVGRLEGFCFAADPAAGGSEAKALHAAAQKVLAGEIDARAAKLSQAPDEQFVLTSDGTIRWTGDAVGKLTAGEDALHPRIRILADEQLTGPSREQVQARLDQWLKAHIEKLLGPLASLAAAEDVTGIARGVAYRLIEDLGVLERQKVAEDVKGLDQNQRASLRKYGVRFGAYHIYIPQLLKPAPRTLATLLYALKHDTGEMRGLDEVQQLASSGRTSIAANKEVAKNLYRVAGYRVAGERAVRVDILERLADLIRPALAWRDNAPGIKPAGALDGTGFTITVGMTSLVGSSGEDFASILRSLGYRMERRPKPPEPVAPVIAAEAAPEAAPEAEAVPVAEAAPEPAPVAETANEPEVIEPAPQAAAETAEPSVEASEVAAADTPAEVVAAAAPAEPELIEVWRPGRIEHRERRPHGRHRRDKGRGKPGDQQPAAAAQAASGEGTPSEAPAEGVAAAADAQQPAPAENRQHRGPRPPRPDRGDRHGRPPRHDRQRHDGQRSGKPGGGPRHEQRGDQRPRPERREKQPDPNSPFAKLAALKAQLEADSKERH
jgi:ATP-dependent RNA helicase SUPV3L1/SUV3